MPGLALPHDDQTDLLLAYLEQQRAGIRNAAFGLSDEQARLAPTAGTLSIGGLVKHVSQTERHWVDIAVPSAASGIPADYQNGFRLLDHETLDDVLDTYDEVARSTEKAIRSSDLADPVPVPRGVPWFPKDVEAWSVRWVLLHIIEETARHAGHADIVRESIDGATMYPLMAAVEGWPATDWLTPWSPAAG